jgi:hypothetical protein
MDGGNWPSGRGKTMSVFRICFVAVFIGFVAFSLARRHDNHAYDPMTALMTHLTATGHGTLKSTKALWGVPSVALSVDNCPTPVNVIPFDFDEIASPGVLSAARSARHTTLQISYAGQTFETFDLAALYRLRLRNDIAQIIHTHDLEELPVILSFWPAGCAPRVIL